MSLTTTDDQLACKPNAIGMDDDLKQLPRELQCDAVAHHLTQLASKPGGSFEFISAHMAKSGYPLDAGHVKAMADKTRADRQARCEELPWSVAIRRCLLASRTESETTTCW